MPKTIATEWFLRLFTTPDRAAGIAGDMSEEGRVSWFDTLRTAAMLLVRNAASQPLRLVVLVLLGVCLMLIAANLLIMPFRHLAFGASFPVSVQVGLIFGQRILAPAMVGYMLTLLAKRRDLTACVAFVIAQVLFMLFLVLRGSPVEYSQLQSATFVLIRGVFPWVSVLIGGTLARRQFLRHELRQAV